ncbi:DEAD/DEAH box helicase family protein [Proteiniclasticum sp. BAD-10]|uniref:DEAD/DEAH box helicase family protein n=1 Tax=Proteiniclasticum sediminis TaxID=2804028 RepID=A0A941CPK3_9CLOT|nr:DEAD/DEAH box helicase family protein [Proteiniclasticum sediminis]MBR0575058.1 DEAD/DEAH box helicase family protein [Proteiniclasticum sediminis]
MDEHQLLEIIRELREENFRLKSELLRLKKINNPDFQEVHEIPIQTQLPILELENFPKKSVTRNSSKAEKIALFQSLFRGRDDVCAKRWRSKPGYSPYCFHDFQEGICQKPKVKCVDCRYKSFAPLDEERIEGHLLGKYVLGLYPMTQDDTCYLLVMDFDESTWKEEVRAVQEVCRQFQIPVYAERSRSGNGCHLWFFFQEEMKASVARKFGISLLSEAMRTCENIHFSSFDRLFPSQDFLQKDGFGNLIALPLQKEPREQGNTVFVDLDFQAVEDQWAFLSEIRRISAETVSGIIETLHEDEEVNVLNTQVKFSESSTVNTNDFPHVVKIEKGQGLCLSKAGLTPRALLLLRKMGSYPNPEFFAKQAIRQTTFGTPRMAIVYEENATLLILPRGLETRLKEELEKFHVPYQFYENRVAGHTYLMNFQGTLSHQQEEAFQALSKKDDGVLSAATGFGKTVVGARLIAEKSCATLILVHTKELAKQWKERLEQFLDVSISLEELPNQGKRKKTFIGELGGGKQTLKGVVDIAIMQSLFETDKTVKSLIHQYGMIIVDECHHVSAQNFRRILSEADARYVYGLTATPIRKDGHHPSIFMFCGPIRYTVDAKAEAQKRTFDHYLIPRFTSLRMPFEKESKEWHITEVYKHLSTSETRNKMIIQDVSKALMEGRTPLILTERTEHVSALCQEMENQGVKYIVLTGKLKRSERREAGESIAKIREGGETALIATGRLVGEGFDLPRLDTLFLAMPIAWKGTITQYSGRLHREFEGKEEVHIYDYVDINIPVLERMYHKRLSAYKAVGYSLKDYGSVDESSGIYDDNTYLEPLITDLQNAQRNILISSTFITRKKYEMIKDILIEKFQSGVRVTLVLKEFHEYPEKYRGNMFNIVQELSLLGFEVIHHPDHHLKAALIDRHLVWYGGLDLLATTFEGDTVIRVKDEVLANEIIGELMRSE